MKALHPGSVPLSDPGTHRPAPASGGNLAAARQPVVLVVDDEPMVRAVLAAALGQYGVAVLLAAGGQQALELYEQHREGIALVLLDRRMPGLDGLQTLAAIRRLDPGVRCCLMSGAHDAHTGVELQALSVACVFSKPFILAKVAQTIRHLLAGDESR